MPSSLTLLLTLAMAWANEPDPQPENITHTNTTETTLPPADAVGAQPSEPTPPVDPATPSGPTTTHAPSEPPAATPAPAAPEAKAEKKPKLDLPDLVSFHGTYQIWGLSQHGFLLGADVPLNDADYAVQMLRGNLKVGTDDFAVTARFDAAQGWWGVDNEPESELVTRTAEDGTLIDQRVYNPYALFRNKDTNYTVHFDHAFATIKLPKIPVTLRAGRQPYGLGHLLVLDMDLDGLQVDIKPIEPLKVGLFWAMMSEGQGSYKMPLGTLMSDKDGNADANLFGLSLQADVKPMTLGLFAAAYLDRSGDGTAAYLPDGLGYAMARFRPNLSTVVAAGVTADGTIKVLDGLNLAAEVDILWGKDEIKNTTHAGGLLDINDGTLGGYNVYIRLDQGVLLGKPRMHFGAAFGLGSGDPDPTGGRGNINAIQTQGLFNFTNVWEDSVMPDIGGISPQGLGSPVSRGYREFENTTAVQAVVGVAPVPQLSFDVSYSWIHATRPIHAFDATGVPTDQTSSNLGHEVDVNASWKIYKKVSYDVLFGVFLPGSGAGYLMVGHDDDLKPAWEVKQVLAVGF
jgi:hypothetical protein